ncbi:MAG: FemAB family PEP-CTERM system-associated protein [Paraglaciecola sp.]|nr:FemAB family PEP-CTERM system-associated protein [Paraglaciecola sp.]NCT47320.1 FemAB family PEP-CTERM system-associated protein [Paraglaciecola sp.]
MTFRIESASQLSAKVWDDYVAQHNMASAYHKKAWVQSVVSAYGHQDVSLVAMQGEQVVGLLPCIKLVRPLLGATFCSLPFCDLGAALADNEPIKQALVDELCARAKGQHFEHRETAHEVVAADADMLADQKVRMVMPLPATAEALFDGFKSKLRSQIRKAQKNGLTVSLGNSAQLIDAFYQIFAENMRKLGSPVHGKKWFLALSQYYAEHMTLAVVYSDDLPIGAGIVLRQGNNMVIPWASTLASHNRLAPNMLLYWSLLEHACVSGCQQFDFGRSTFGEGTFKFKQQWGAEPIALRWHTYNDVATAQAVTTNPGRLRHIVEQIWARLPLSVTVALGPKIRKYISL